MSKLLRLPLTLLAVLAALFFLPSIAFGAPPPTPEQCAADATLDGCTAPTDSAGGHGATGSAEVVQPPLTIPSQNTATDGTSRGGTPAGAVVPNRVQGALVAPDVTTAA